MKCRSLIGIAIMLGLVALTGCKGAKGQAVAQQPTPVVYKDVTSGNTRCIYFNDASDFERNVQYVEKLREQGWVMTVPAGGSPSIYWFKRTSVDNGHERKGG